MWLAVEKENRQMPAYMRLFSFYLLSHALVALLTLSRFFVFILFFEEILHVS